jgi:3',5'-cyclic AMP phosphodiesterase CpdA
MKNLTCCILLALLPSFLLAQNNLNGVQIAFLADVHLQDIYGRPSDTDYKGILNPKTGKYTLVRTMEAQLHSTRLFNENYFAFLAALDDIAQRGIKYVALPGDYSDDGQPLNIRGLQTILNEYTHKYGIQFFITTGNHDPVGPFAKEGGKNDFLGAGGKRQPVFSKEGLYTANATTELTTIVSKDISMMGYTGITDYLKDFGFYPKEDYKFWATPFSTYSPADYNYEKAEREAVLEKRTYEVAPGYTVPDVSYIVEPVKGLWLMAIDGNVYIPKSTYDGNPENPDNYSGASIGYNNVLSNKKHLIDWVQKMAAEAKLHGKTLIAFSHYPMVDYNDDASAQLSELFGKGKWQLERVPVEDVAQSFANAGLQVHFAGHMHINDTGIRTTPEGNTLVNIQTPSLAAYIPAYKLLTIKGSELEVETITVNNVPRFNELFDLYKMEHDFLESQKATDVWDDAILKTKSYHDFTQWHLKELVRLRFLPDDWAKPFTDFLLQQTGEDLLVLASKSDIETKTALKEAGLKRKGFKKWNGFDLIFDFYRLHSADELALADIGNERIKQYKFLIGAYLNKYTTEELIIDDNPNLDRLKHLFSIMDKFLHADPADHFSIDLKTGTVKDLKK